MSGPSDTQALGRVTTRLLRFGGVAIVLAMVPVVLAATTDLALVWYRIAGLGAVYAMAVLSLNLLMGYAGQISLGHTAFLAIGAYTAGWVTTRAGVSFVVGFMLATFLGALVALVVGLPALRLRGLLLAVTTLAFLLVVLESLLQFRIVSSGSVGAVLDRPELGPISLQHNAHYLAFLLVALTAFWWLDANVTNSRVGRAFLGLREDEQVAASYGIDIARTKLTAFVLSGAMAGFAGAAYGHLIGQVQSADFRLELSLSLVAWVIIGGLGSRVGVVVAGLLFGVFPFAFEQLLATGNVRIFSVVVALLVATLGIVWMKTSGRAGWRPGAGVAVASIAVAALFEKAVGAGDIREFALILGAAAFLVTVAVNPNGFVGSIREHRDDLAAKAARAALRRGDAEADEPTFPELPVPPARHGQLEPGTPVLEVDDVTVRFGGLVAVNGVSLVVPAGEIVGLIGPNGAGKTTLFDAIGGFNQPETGSVRLLSRDLSALPAHARALAGLGRTFQRTGLAMSLSMRDNLLLATHSLLDYDTLSALQGAPSVVAAETEVGQRADDIIAALGFEALADLPARHLSGGQRRIVEMACTLATAPDLLMLDEPTAGMAPAAVENLAERLRELRDRHSRTILLIEHHVPLVLDVCDRVYVLDHGRVVAQGTPADIMRDPVVLEAYLGVKAQQEAAAADEASTIRVRQRVPQSTSGDGAAVTPLLELKDVSTGFGGNTVLHGIDLQVQPGEITGMLGLNGAGKTVALKVVAGIQPAWGGRILLDGQDVTGLDAEDRVRAGMGHVTQGRQVFGDLTVEENLRLGAYTLRASHPERYDERLELMLDRFPRLRERTRQRAGTMSGGEQAMLAVARALMSEPRLLLVDEPSAGLAPLIVGEVFELLSQVNADGVTILLVEQNIAFALDVVDSVHVLQRGRIVHSGTSADLDRAALTESLGIGRLLSQSVELAGTSS